MATIEKWVTVVLYVAATVGTILGIGIALVSCGGPEPLPASRCVDNADLGNCGLCASQPVCGWCASDTASERGCYDRRTITCDQGVVVRLPEACEMFSDTQTGLSE
jgi:hypothetical protein